MKRNIGGSVVSVDLKIMRELHLIVVNVVECVKQHEEKK